MLCTAAAKGLLLDEERKGIKQKANFEFIYVYLAPQLKRTSVRAYFNSRSNSEIHFFGMNVRVTFQC